MQRNMVNTTVPITPLFTGILTPPLTRIQSSNLTLASMMQARRSAMAQPR